MLRWTRSRREVPPGEMVDMTVVPKADQWAQLPSQGDTLNAMPVRKHRVSLGSMPRLGKWKPRARLQGWKAGAVSAAALATVTLIINVVAVAWLKRHPNEDGSLVELFRGSCDRVESMHIWSHLLINALGTLLLSGSNYCMQVLASPTREEIDRAHARKRWLDIGVPSVRNIWRISPYRAIMWWILGLSSIPLHLLYNSAFYASIGVANYRVDFVSPDFRSNGTMNEPSAQLFRGQIGTEGVRVEYSRPDACVTDNGCRIAALDHLARLQADADTVLEELSAQECISAYGNALLTDRSNLIIVTPNRTEDDVLQADYSYTFSNAVELRLAVYKPFEWIYSSSDRMVSHFPQLAERLEVRPVCEAWLSSVVEKSDLWTPRDYDVDHCLSEVIEQRCSFSGNISILSIVIVCNAIKIICMLFVAFGLDENAPLITMGDAVSSFLTRPDSTTKGRCLWARNDMSELLGNNVFDDGKPAKPKVAVRRRRRWEEAASRSRWSCTLFLLGLAISIVLGLFGAGYSQLRRHNTPISALGFGKIHASAVVNGWGIVQISTPGKQIIAAILVANFPQTVLSFLYLNLNGLVTSLWLSVEWLSYATTRKTLRVSRPTGDQRMTFFLQLPYKVGVPLMILSGVLHWLVSQSFFLAVVAEYDWEGTLINPTAMATCGYSLIPMMAVMAIGAGLVSGLVFMGWVWKLDGQGEGEGVMPLAGSCSATISAACHPPPSDVGAEGRPVMWGSVDHEMTHQHEDVGHCSFTSEPVGFVIEGKKYI